MGILDKVFAGQKGIVNVLAEKLGGTATIVYVTKGNYNKVTDSYSDTETTQTVNFLPSTCSDIIKTSYVSTNGGFSMSGGLERENFDLAGTISAAEITTIPEPNKDKIRYNGKTFYIVSIKTNYVGEVAISYAITAKI